MESAKSIAIKATTNLRHVCDKPAIARVTEPEVEVEDEIELEPELLNTHYISATA